MSRRSPRSTDYERDTARLDMAEELRSIIAERIERHGRSQQTAIGASELGTPCVRKLALKLAGAPPVPEQVDGDDNWRATVGTAVHDWLARMLEADNERLAAEAEAHERMNTEAVLLDGPCHPWCDRHEHKARWLVETRTAVGTIDGVEIMGTMDVYDRWSHTAIDWKVPGPTAIKSYRQARDPGPEYRTQIQLYGRGLARRLGEDVKWVAIMFLPANGELKGSYYWETEYDPEIGKDAFTRARELTQLVRDEGDDVFRKLKTVNDHCVHCPFFSPGTNDPLRCPGDPSMYEGGRETFVDLLPKGEPKG